MTLHIYCLEAWVAVSKDCQKMPGSMTTRGPGAGGAGAHARGVTVGLEAKICVKSSSLPV